MLLFAHAEATLNRWIAQSGAAQTQLRALEGRAMRIDVAGTQLRILLQVDEQQMQLRQVDENAAADIVVCAGAFELLELLRADPAKPLVAGEIEFRGSLRIAEQFSGVLRLARPSLEDELAGWIGGVPAHLAAQCGTAVAAWGRKAIASLERDTSQYLLYEAREVPRTDEVADFMVVTETLRDDVERLARRVERLAAAARR